MRYIDNVSEVIDFSGETPVTVVSNNVRTYLNQPTVIPHCPDRQSCRCCRSACDIFRREEDFHDNCRAHQWANEFISPTMRDVPSSLSLL